MDILDIKKPSLEEPLNISYSFTKNDEERMNRKLIRAEEIGMTLFVLDEKKESPELLELENYIIDNYLDLDLDIPEDIKNKYIQLKKQNEQSK